MSEAEDPLTQSMADADVGRKHRDVVGFVCEHYRP